jgi:hypothetical protein
MDPAVRTLLQVRAEDHTEADLMFTTLMGDQVEPRRKFIEDNALDVKNLMCRGFGTGFGIGVPNPPNPESHPKSLHQTEMRLRPAPAPRQYRRRDEAFVHGLRHERDHWTSAARRPRRLKPAHRPVLYG